MSVDLALLLASWDLPTGRLLRWIGLRGSLALLAAVLRLALSALALLVLWWWLDVLVVVGSLPSVRPLSVILSHDLLRFRATDSALSGRTRTPTKDSFPPVRAVDPVAGVSALPVHRRLERRTLPNVAAGAIVFVTTALVIAPLVVIVRLAVLESIALIDSVRAGEITLEGSGQQIAELIGVSDGYLRAVIVDRCAEVNPSIIVLGVPGGIFVFGGMGIFYGPVIIGLLRVTPDVFREEPLLDEELALEE